MPIYEYSCKKCGIIEIIHSIKDDAKIVCPQCGKSGLERQISLIAGFIDKNRQGNQYSDILKAKYWVDKNGNKHRVTPSDGNLNSPTVSSKVTVSKEEFAAKRKLDSQLRSIRRRKESYNRFLNSAKKAKRK